MATPSLSQLLRLPPDERAELAIALWESLTEAEREAEFGLTEEQMTDLDRRWAQHLEDPTSAIPWDDVHQRLRGRS